MTRKVEKVPRRTLKGGYSRGDETRMRIIETALDMFGQSGFEQTSTRAIAQRANVNLGVLIYYFGNKEGLYSACADHIASSAEARSGPILAEIESALANDRLMQDELMALLRTYVDLTTEDLVSGDDPQNWLLFMTREQANPAAASEVIYKRVTVQLLGVLTALIGRIVGHPPDEPETIIRALAIMGQLINFRRMRRATLRALGWPDFQGDRGAWLKDILWDQIANGLAQPRATSPGPQ
jgi:TetR/AcrR family transcriptional regulator, regulator of cefoperazone and chloramphenicol sensitivity